MFETYCGFEEVQRRLAMPRGDQVTMPIAQARSLRDAYALSLVRGLTEVNSSCDHVLDGPAGPFRVRMTVPLGQVGNQVILLVRGCGHWSGSLETHDQTARSLAHLTGLRVCAVDYHLIPEFSAPTQLQEVSLALEALFDEAFVGNQPEPVLLYGESAGAHLCLSLAIQERDAGRRRLVGMVLFYPGPFGPARHRDNRSYQWVWANYAGEGEGPGSLHIPMNHDLKGICPAWIGVGGADMLFPDCVDLAKLLGDAGVAAELRTYPELPHGFVGFSTQVKPAQEALHDAAAALGKFSEATHAAL